MGLSVPDSPPSQPQPIAHEFERTPSGTAASTFVQWAPCGKCGLLAEHPIHQQGKPSMEELIAQSVFRFEAKLSTFGVLTMAKAAGWVNDYRKELEGIAAAAKAQ